MLLFILLPIFVGLIIIGIFVHNLTHYGSDNALPLYVIGGVLTLILLIVILVGSITLMSESTIDQRIQMYTEENETIESNLKEVVTMYLEHEGMVFENIKNTSTSIIITLYPELKADILISKQIDILLENNNKIKELKNERLNIQVWKKVLYFGK